MFRISEEEEEQFDEDHEDLIREKMAPLIDRIIPFETTDENRFNDNNSKITTEEIRKRICECITLFCNKILRGNSVDLLKKFERRFEEMRVRMLETLKSVGIAREMRRLGI